MAESRDDFVIAVRSAFLKKANKQKFSLLTLILLSLIIIILGSFNFKAIQYTKKGINELVYRFTYITSIPENYITNSYFKISDHLDLFNKFKKNEILLKSLREKELSIDYLILENKKLRKLIDETIQSKEIYAKVLADNESPYLKSIILNKGSKDNVKMGMAILDGSYLVGKIIEVNFTNSRALLLSDLNSKIPVLLEPHDMQAVLSGTGQNYGIIEYTKEEYRDAMKGTVIVYTSGQGGLFKPGLPVGKLIDENDNKSLINFFSDFKQLDYVKIVSYEIGGIN
ncbi:MAG: rod shape-determining protein MreC [Pelagibacterales bacterium MED-G42]|nr:MAG: rod shape-determining protein MreC [Pelagibacterales bacterium MED-G42]